METMIKQTSFEKLLSYISSPIFARQPALIIPEVLSNLGQILRVVRTIFEALQVRQLLIARLYILIAWVVLAHELLDLIPVPTFSVLTISWLESVNSI